MFGPVMTVQDATPSRVVVLGCATDRRRRGRNCQGAAAGSPPEPVRQPRLDRLRRWCWVRGLLVVAEGDSRQLHNAGSYAFGSYCRGRGARVFAGDAHA